MATDGKYGHMTSLRRKPGVTKADKRRRNANEVIVYLDDYIYSTDNVYQTVYLDFRTDKDLAAFKDAIGSSDEKTRKYLEHKDEGYLEITNYHSSKRLTSGAYYALIPIKTSALGVTLYGYIDAMTSLSNIRASYCAIWEKKASKKSNTKKHRSRFIRSEKVDCQAGAPLGGSSFLSLAISQHRRLRGKFMRDDVPNHLVIENTGIPDINAQHNDIQ